MSLHLRFSNLEIFPSDALLMCRSMQAEELVSREKAKELHGVRLWGKKKKGIRGDTSKRLFMTELILGLCGTME